MIMTTECYAVAEFDANTGRLIKYVRNMCDSRLIARFDSIDAARHVAKHAGETFRAVKVRFK